MNIDRRRSGWLLLPCIVRTIIVWCGVAALACVAAIIDSWTAEAPHLPTAVWAVPYVGVIAVVATLILKGSGGSPTRAIGGIVRSLPRSVKWGAPLAVVAAVLMVALTVPEMPIGAPETTSTGYQLDSRFGTTLISRTEYLRDLALSQRLFSAVGLAMNVLIATLALGTQRRERVVTSRSPQSSEQ